MLVESGIHIRANLLADKVVRAFVIGGFAVIGHHVYFGKCIDLSARNAGIRQVVV